MQCVERLINTALQLRCTQKTAHNEIERHIVPLLANTLFRFCNGLSVTLLHILFERGKGEEED